MSDTKITATPRAGLIRSHRARLGLSRERVASQLGVSSKTVERAEQGRRVKRSYLIDLATLYGVDPTELEEAA